MAPKRDPELLAKMVEEFYQCVVESPGGSMTSFTKTLGYSALELQVPVGMLKKNKRVRTTGARLHTRYFAVSA